VNAVKAALRRAPARAGASAPPSSLVGLRGSITRPARRRRAPASAIAAALPPPIAAVLWTGA